MSYNKWFAIVILVLQTAIVACHIWLEKISHHLILLLELVSIFIVFVSIINLISKGYRLYAEYITLLLDIMFVVAFPALVGIMYISHIYTGDMFTLLKLNWYGYMHLGFLGCIFGTPYLSCLLTFRKYEPKFRLVTEVWSYNPDTGEMGTKQKTKVKHW
jgi:hypothetical protein